MEDLGVLKRVMNTISVLVTAALFLAGCNYSDAMSSIPPEVVEKFPPQYSMAEADKPGSDWAGLDIKGNVAEGFDPSLGDYLCGADGCEGHAKADPTVDGWEVCSNSSIEQDEIYYCSDAECIGHEYEDEECNSTFDIDMSFVVEM